MSLSLYLLKTEIVKHRIFIASPMSGFNDEIAYKENREIVLSTLDHLSNKSELQSVYFAGQHIKSKADFTPSKSALENDISALENADIFLLIYPDRVFSSVLIEIGYAMALNKSILIMIKKREDLPYLLKQAEEVWPNITIELYEEENSLKEKIDNFLLQLLS